MLDEEFSDEEKRSCQRKLADMCIEYLADNADHCIFDVSGKEKIYDIGFVYCDFMAEESLKTELSTAFIISTGSLCSTASNNASISFLQRTAPLPWWQI